MTTANMNVMTQTDIHYPLGEYPYGYDIPAYISIYDRPKRPIGRPKNKIQLTDEEKERMRKFASNKYYENIDKRKLQQALNHQRVRNEKAQKALIL